ncbi:Integrin alpha-2 [Trinorchestia longiramus]|nr:Integrin alpha-2 [Trinorchestia longiramus]
MRFRIKWSSPINPMRILVGAPKDQNLQPGTTRSGALWKCPFTSNTSDCVQVQTDGYKDPATGLYDFFYVNQDLLPPHEDEIKDDQWLGVTVKSQGAGGDVLVCAHRYMQRGPGFQWGFGLCYLLNQNLDVTDSMEPCRGKAVAKGHQQYGFCQAGMSGLILEDEVVLGLPGPYTWRGTVHTSNISKNFLLRDKTQYFGPVTENDSPVDKYSYLGYSVTTGYFFGDYVSYVGGAPRSNGTGQVVFFSRAKIGESLLVVDLILDGEMFASSFGFEILGLDINQDGFDDLLVGAPFYYKKHSSGAVYVYINNRDGIKKNHKFTRIEGPPGESRFGFSMTSLGDLNRDGFLDVAIGAPYEDRGAIYIYLGSADGLVVEPSQVIKASNLPGPTYDAFGYALSGGLDMDNNGYPDLLTSSFCSDRVVLIRTRPVIKIQTIVVPEGGPRNIDPTRPGCPDDQSSEDTCFSFEACFKMDNDAGTRTGLLLSYNIEERVYRDQPLPRVYFYKDAQQQPSKPPHDWLLLLFTSIKETLQIPPLLPQMGPYLCAPTRSDLVHCTLGNPFTNSTGPLLLAFKPSGFFEQRFIHFEVFANSTSNELTPQKPIDLVLEILKRAEISIKGSVEPEQVFFSGDVVGESGVKSIEEIGAEVIHKYVVDNRGPWRVDYTDVEILWPHQVENFEPQGKWLLYLVDTPTVDGDGECEVDPEYVNPVGLPWKRSPSYSPFEGVDGEAEVTTFGKPITPEPESEGESGVVTTGSTNRTTVTKTVSSSSTINTVRSETSKTTKKDETHSSSSVHETAGSGDEEYDYYDYEDNAPDRRYDRTNVGRGGVRTHSRVSRRVYSTRTDTRNRGEILDGGEPEIIDTFSSRHTGPGYDRHPYPEEDRYLDRSEPKSPEHDSQDISFSSRTHSSSGHTENRIDGDRTRASWRTDDGSRHVDSSDPHAAGAHRSGWSSTKRVKTTRIHSASGGGDTSHIDNDWSRYDDRSKFEDRMGRVDAGSENGEHWESRTFDGGRGREDRRWSSKTSADPDGTVRAEDRVEYKRTHSSADFEPGFDTSEGIRNTNRSEHSRRVYTSRVSLTSGDRDRGDDWDRIGNGDTFSGRGSQNRYELSNERDSNRIRFTPIDDGSSRFSSPDETLDRDSSWRSRSFDGSGGEDRRRVSDRRFDEDSPRTVVERNEAKRQQIDDDRSSGSADRNVDAKRTEYSKRVQTSRVSSISGSDAAPGVNYDSERSPGQSSLTRDRESYGSTYLRENLVGSSVDGDINPTARSRGGTSTIYQSSGSSSHSSRTPTNYLTDPAHENTIDVSNRRTYSPYDDDNGSRSTHSRSFSSRTFSSSDRGTPRSESRWRFGGFRSGARNDMDNVDLAANESLRFGGSPRSNVEDGLGSWTSGREDTSKNDFGSRSWSSNHGGESQSWTTKSSDSYPTRRTNGWSSSGSHHSRGNTVDSGHHDVYDDDYDYYDYDDETDSDHNSGRTYTKTVIDDKTGEAKVYSRREFDGFATQWREADSRNPSHYPVNKNSESSSNAHSEGELRHSLIRVKREKEMIVQPEAYTDDQTGRTLQVVNLRCTGDVPTAKCIPIRCTIRNLGAESSASIRVVSRLWNATLVEDYAHVNLVNVQSRGELLLPEDLRSRQDQSDDVAVAETKAYANLLEQSQSVPLWVILVSVFAGLLLLALIILLLWKMGFFERKRPDSTPSGNSAKNGY